MIKKKDFIEINYTGKIKNTDKVFDTTEEKVAKENNFYSDKTTYKPLIICVGEKQVVPGLDDFLIGKKPGKYNITLKPKDAFGDKNPKLIRIMNANIFKKQEIRPMPGLQVNVDGAIGIIRTVTGGRVIVDFNHPLSGREIEYNLEIKRIVKDDNEKAQSLFQLLFNKDAVIKDNIATLDIEMPKEVQEQFNEKIKELVPSIKKVEFMKKKTTSEK